MRSRTVFPIGDRLKLAIAAPSTAIAASANGTENASHPGRNGLANRVPIDDEPRRCELRSGTRPMLGDQSSLGTRSARWETGAPGSSLDGSGNDCGGRALTLRGLAGKTNHAARTRPDKAPAPARGCAPGCSTPPGFSPVVERVEPAPKRNRNSSAAPPADTQNLASVWHRPVGVITIIHWHG